MTRLEVLHEYMHDIEEEYDRQYIQKMRTATIDAYDTNWDKIYKLSKDPESGNEDLVEVLHAYNGYLETCYKEMYE